VLVVAQTYLYTTRRSPGIQESICIGQHYKD
jgi:hypothetical protein